MAILEPFALAIAFLLSYIYDFIVSYGFSIALLTVVINVVIFPLTLRQTRSTKRMQDAQSDIKALQKKHKENKVRITTDFGEIDIKLFEATKFHRSNFIYLTKKKYFNNTQFYRVINNYIIQGGNSDDQQTLNKRKKIGRYLLPNDHKKGFKHDRGMVSMPSSAVANPYKMASPFEFFIVQQHGGAHNLDGDYAVFGKVVKGMEVVDKIAAVPTDKGDWPQTNIYIKKIEIIE